MAGQWQCDGSGSAGIEEGGGQSTGTRACSSSNQVRSRRGDESLQFVEPVLDHHHGREAACLWPYHETPSIG